MKPINLKWPSLYEIESQNLCKLFVYIESSGVSFSSLSGRGESEVRTFLEDLGYKVMEVI